ncbi:MAG: PEP-CTERM sorting domain-containing protein [Bryobacterales bacterium]|nr:PEP-CTERM sorting domain-containing protein [Bryobacterales bacterium]
MLIKTLLSAAILAASSFGAVVQALAPGDLAPGPFTIHDFETTAGGPGATYSSPSGVRQFAGVSIGPAHSGNFTLSTNVSGQSITIAFDNPVTAFGLWFGNDDTCCSSGFTASLDAFDSNGLLGTVSLIANMNDAHDQFLGFNSSDPVTSVTLSYSSGANALYRSIDDVMFNTGDAVPEPSTLLLAASSLAALIALRRRSAN